MNPTVYDLHSHSIASDGTLAPAELVRRAAAAGVDALALTDHDCTDGLAEAGETAAAAGITLIPGVEISVSWGGRTVHIVGLRIDPADRNLQDGLRRLVEFRGWRAREIARGLEAAGIDDAYEGARSYARGSIIGRTHFARHIVARGRAPSVRDVFRNWLVKGKPGHVAGQWASLEEAVSWIRGAGGDAVIAHPARYKLTATKLRRLIAEFKACGGVGIEVVSGSHGRDEVQAIAAHCRAEGLLASAGSDYHGPENPWVALGALAPLPAGCTPVWSGWT